MITPSPCYFHKVERKETWHFNVGKPVLIMEIFPNNEIKETIMGNDILKIMNDEQQPQFKTTPGNWMAVCLKYVYDEAVEYMKKMENGSEKEESEKEEDGNQKKKKSVHDKCKAHHNHSEEYEYKPQPAKIDINQYMEKTESYFALIGLSPPINFDSQFETKILSEDQIET